MDAILLVNMLPEGIQELNRELRQGYPEIVNRLDIGLVCDIWSRELREGTCEPLHPSVGRPEIGRAPRPDRYDVWSVRRSARAVAIPRTASGNESRVQRAVGNRLAQKNEGLEDPLAPISPATEQERHRRG